MPKAQQAEGGSPKVAECERPPEGWRCTRTPGHDGPCAAVPVAGFATDDLDRPSHGQVWLDKESGFTVGVLSVCGDGPTVSGIWHRSLDPDDGFEFSLAEFTARFLPLAVDPSCISSTPVSALLSDEAKAAVAEALRDTEFTVVLDEGLKKLPTYGGEITWAELADVALRAAIKQVQGGEDVPPWVASNRGDRP
jgi:hypothetical protein